MINLSNMLGKIAAAVSAIAISAVFMATAIVPASPALTAPAALIA